MATNTSWRLAERFSIKMRHPAEWLSARAAGPSFTPAARRSRRGLSWILAAALLGPPSALHAQESARPLPDASAFLRQVREHLQSDHLLQSQYTYYERRQKVQIGRLGGVSMGPVKVYEVYPSLAEGQTYKRLISVDGTPLTPEELEKQDREFRASVQAEAASPQRAAERQRRFREAQRKEREVIEDIYGLYEMTILGRDTIDGHSAILGAFTPRAGYRPRTDLGRFLENFKGQAWISESDYQIIRLEAEAIRDITYGLGLLGRLHEGARASFQRRKIDGRVWLPVEFRFAGTGRSLVFRKFIIDTVTEYYGYRRYAATTDLRFGISEDPSAPRRAVP
jgi:hypothetical protein